jgi:uncharacterized protein (DUF1800 family)
MADWSLENAAHLLTRVGFGGTPEEIQKFYDKFDGATGSPEGDLATAVADIVGFREKKSAPPRPKDTSDKSYDKMVRWWLKRMSKSRRWQDAAREKLVLFFHNFLACGASKSPELRYMSWQNRTFRIHCNRNFKELIRELNRDPANLYYLDGILNEASSDSVHATPNENWGRELMELFTIGPFELQADGLDDPSKPNYTEDDVHNLARASTGWTDIEGELGVFKINDWDGGQYSDDDNATPDDIVIFGQVANTWRYDPEGIGGDDAKDVLYHLMDEKFDDEGNNQCAMFVARKVWEWYAYPAPSPGLKALLAPHAEAFRLSGYDMTTLLTSLFTDDAFYSDEAKSRTVKNPADYCVQALTRVGSTANGTQIGSSKDYLSEIVADMGMLLFEPPNVAGWPGGLNWITSATLLKRMDFAKDLAEAQKGASKIRFKKWHDGFPLGDPAADPAVVVDAILTQVGLDVGPMALTQPQKDELVRFITDDNTKPTLDLSDDKTQDVEKFVRGALAMALQAAEMQVF